MGKVFLCVQQSKETCTGWNEKMMTAFYFKHPFKVEKLPFTEILNLNITIDSHAIPDAKNIFDSPKNQLPKGLDKNGSLWNHSAQNCGVF